jgi:hypothetical protein
MAQICTRVSVSYRVHKNRGSGSVAKLLTRDEVQMAVNIAKLPEYPASPERLAGLSC